jgi:hypothetical protein
MQGASSLQVVQFLAVSQRETGKPFEGLPNREVLSFHVACRDVARVWSAVSNLYYRLRQRGGGVSASRIVLAVIPKYFYDLGEIGLSSEHVFDSLPVEMKSVRCQLEAVFLCDPIPQHRQKPIRSFAGSLANGIGRNQFRVCIQGHENPSISEFRGILWLYVTLLLATESPNFVSLNSLAAKITQLRVHQLLAALPSDDQQFKNRVAVQLRNAFCAANACAFLKQLNRKQRLILRHRHAAKQASAAFCVGLSTLNASEARKAASLLPKLRARDIASRAIHGVKIQQALAVCQAKLPPTFQLYGGI